MKKLFGLLLALAMLAAVFTVAAFAEGAEYFYVNSASGNDASDASSADAAVKTFTHACRLAERSGAEKAYIVITNEYKFPQTVHEQNHTVPFVLTTKDETTDYAEENGAKLVFGNNLRYVMKGDTTFEDIAIEYGGTLNFVAQYNHITFGDNVVTTRSGSESSGIYIVGGWQSPDDSYDTTLDSHITVKSGSFLYVIGGSRQRGAGASGLVLTGTHYIDIQGGEIATLLGASAQHNWSHSAVITMSGGKVKSFCTGGDVSRRLNGDATVVLTGGEIGTLNVNNVVGNATVKLLGTKVENAKVSYENAEVTNLEKKANSTKTLIYDANYYTDEQIESFDGFDVKKNNAVLFVKDGASGTGLSESDPASFENAFKTATENEAIVTVIGKVTLDSLTEVAHASAVTVTGKDETSAIEVKGTYTLSGETVFDSVELIGNFNAENGMLVTTENTVANINIVGNATLVAGNIKSVTGAGKVVVNGATVETIVGGSDSASIEIHSGTVGTVKSTDTSIDNFALTVGGGSVEKVVFNNVAKTLSYTLMGGEVKAYEVSGNNVSGSLTLNEQFFNTDSLGSAAALFTKVGEKVFFLADDGNGSGATPNAPSSSLDAAYEAIGESGGTIVITAPFTIVTDYKTGTNNGKITFTSVYDGIDYAKTNDAKMLFSANFFCGGETEFKNITLKNNAHYRSIYANCHKLVLGKNITSLCDDQYNSYLSVMGGNQSAIIDATTDVTINSGIWQKVRGGTAADGSKNSTVNLVINGGEFRQTFTLGSTFSHDGDINATINGGTIYCGVYASTLGDAHHLNSNVTLTINGGTIYGNISPADPSATNKYLGTFSGTYTLNINGGDFSHATDIRGTSYVSGMTSTLNVASNVDLDKAIEGTYTFTNPIRGNGADPWIFFCDGYYYYTATAGSAVSLWKAPNIGDLKWAEQNVIFDPEDGQMWSKNLWSPEIHYYTDEEIGVGNGGWYLFLACDDGNNINHRMYVVKCLDGDNLLGRWGNPITGEVNVPQRVEAKDIKGFDDTWAAGMSEIRINGKLYMLYITETGDKRDPNLHQTINIVEMTNPWTIVGQSRVICRSEYDWEKGGYGKSAGGSYWPMVVEGSTAVYAEDGSVYIIYSGSGYWTVHYNLAQLKYIGGDPLEITSWEKKPEPILYKSDSINGCGHASYVTDTDGQGWVCYHAYTGKDTSSGRFAFVEPYFADKNGVVIANGSGHPAPIETEYTVNVNPLPLSKRISGFDKIESVAASTTTVKLTIGSTTAYINDAAHTLDAAPINRNSRTMLPVRFLANTFGIDNDGIEWNDATKTATLENATTTIVITIGAPAMTVNGESVALDSPAVIESSRTYLPVRAIANALGVSNDNISWDDATKTATLVK